MTKIRYDNQSKALFKLHRLVVFFQSNQIYAASFSLPVELAEDTVYNAADKMTVGTPKIQKYSEAQCNKIHDSWHERNMILDAASASLPLVLATPSSLTQLAALGSTYDTQQSTVTT